MTAMTDDFITELPRGQMWHPLQRIADHLHSELPGFMFMGFDARCERWHYKHHQTRRYLVIDAAGTAYRRGGRVPLDLAIGYALRLNGQ